jgi:hypothetical protein
VLGDILALEGAYDPASFDLVLCLGNTLPHLIGGARDSQGGARDRGARDRGAASFLAQAHSLLAPGGALLLQTLNFSLPRVGPGFVFPELAAGGAVMRRSYRAGPPEQPGTLRFVVELERDGGVQGAETLLIPLGPAQIGSLLGEAGFAPPRRLAGWDGGAFEADRDLYCITIARA